MPLADGQWGEVLGSATFVDRAIDGSPPTPMEEGIRVKDPGIHFTGPVLISRF